MKVVLQVLHRKMTRNCDVISYPMYLAWDRLTKG